MNAHAKISLPTAAAELTTMALLAALDPHRGKRLAFTYDGRATLPGYHVTEVKAGRFEALDCGANPEAWQETFVQLWDVPAEDDRGQMTVGKFLAIVGKVTANVPIDLSARLTFEVSDGSEAIRIYRAETIDGDDGEIRVALGRRPASCKPRDRWLGKASACGASAASPAQEDLACCA